MGHGSHPMDREMRTAMRNIKASGRVVEMVVDLINGMGDKGRQVVSKLLQFYDQRESTHWNLQGKRFPISKLPDSTITRLIETVTAQKIFKFWVANGRDEAEQYTYYGNSTRTYILLWMEAEYRSIKSKEQRWWSRLLEDDPARRSRGADVLLEKCSERGGHIIVRMNGYHKCSNCYKKVTDEEITDYARRVLRLRLTQC